MKDNVENKSEGGRFAMSSDIGHMSTKMKLTSLSISGGWPDYQNVGESLDVTLKDNYIDTSIEYGIQRAKANYSIFGSYSFTDSQDHRWSTNLANDDQFFSKLKNISILGGKIGLNITDNFIISANMGKAFANYTLTVKDENMRADGSITTTILGSGSDSKTLTGDGYGGGLEYNYPGNNFSIGLNYKSIDFTPETMNLGNPTTGIGTYLLSPRGYEKYLIYGES